MWWHYQNEDNNFTHKQTVTELIPSSAVLQGGSENVLQMESTRCQTETECKPMTGVLKLWAHVYIQKTSFVDM